MNQITDSDFKTSVLDSTLPVVVDFWAEWCGPCRMLSPILEDVATELKDSAVIVKMNVDDNQTIPAQYGIRSIPTLILFKDGQAISTCTGVKQKKDIVHWIKSNI